MYRASSGGAVEGGDGDGVAGGPRAPDADRPVEGDVIGAVAAQLGDAAVVCFELGRGLGARDACGLTSLGRGLVGGFELVGVLGADGGAVVRFGRGAFERAAFAPRGCG